MVEATKFEADIRGLFAREYDDKTSEKAVNAYKMYLEEYHAENGFDFELIQEDISGKDENPSQSMLYKTLLESFQKSDDQTKKQFESQESQNKLYSLLVSFINGLSISKNQPWTAANSNKQKPKKRQSTQADIVLEDIDLENDDNNDGDGDDEKKEQDKESPKKKQKKNSNASPSKTHEHSQSGDGDGNHDDGDDLSDLE